MLFKKGQIEISDQLELIIKRWYYYFSNKKFLCCYWEQITQVPDVEHVRQAVIYKTRVSSDAIEQRVVA